MTRVRTLSVTTWFQYLWHACRLHVSRLSNHHSSRKVIWKQIIMRQKYLCDIRFWFCHAVSGQVTPLRQGKQNPFSFVLCHGVPVEIDYIFNFSNDMVFYCLIYTHLFAHGVLNGQRLSNNIPLNDLIFLSYFSQSNRISMRFFVLPLVFVRNQSHWFSREKIFAHQHRIRFETEASQQLSRNGYDSCILISKVTQLHFHIRILSLS